MKVLDLFCGGGGAARGYIAAGASVTGIDNKWHGNSYPGVFFQEDAISFVKEYGWLYDFIHASPPCQGYSKHTSSRSSKYVSYSKGKDEPKLISKVREILEDTNKPFVIENVMGAKDDMEDPFVLCGTMFGLPISRHRLFETNFFIPTPSHGKCLGVSKRYAEENNIDYRDMSVTGKGRNKGTKDRWLKIMGIEDSNMTQAEVVESIPPAYTEYIFRTWREFYV